MNGPELALAWAGTWSGAFLILWLICVVRRRGRRLLCRFGYHAPDGILIVHLDDGWRMVRQRCRHCRKVQHGH